MTKEGQVDVHIDSAKFKEDKEAFSKSVGEKAKAMKDQVAGLWKKSEGLTGDDKTHAQAELGALQKSTTDSSNKSRNSMRPVRTASTASNRTSRRASRKWTRKSGN